MLIRLLVVASVVLLAPYTAHGQALYSSEPGFYVTVAPQDQPYLLGDQGIWYVGAGARLQNIDVGVRVGRGKDVPPGNPLPVTYIGQTVVEAQVSHSLEGLSSSSGLRMLLASQVIAQDHSQPVQQLPEPVAFRDGRRVSQVGVRFEAQRYWRSGDSTGVQLYPILGGIIEYRSIRQSSILHEPEHVLGQIEGSRRFTLGVVAGIPISVPLGGSQRVVIEPILRLIPIPSMYGMPMAGGISAHLNL